MSSMTIGNRQWCSLRDSLTARCPSGVFDTMIGHCLDVGNLETGGILVGKTSGSRAEVVEATGPAEDSVHGATDFIRSATGLNEYLDGARSRGLHYLGEWHYHPGRHPVPSDDDRETMQSIAHDEDYDCPIPLWIIVGGDLSMGFDAVAGVGRRDGEFEQFEAN